MFPVECLTNRRNFLKGGTGLAFGLLTLAGPEGSTAGVGPQPGFSLAFTWEQVLHNVKR